MARDILSEYGPERSIRSRGSNQGRDQRDVNDYQPPTRVKTPTDPKGPGLHGDNFDYCGSQERSSLRGQTSGGPGLGGDSVRPAGQQGRR